MTPETVKFHGFNLDPRSIRRRLFAPTPPDWVRHQFFVDGVYSDPDWPLNEWIANNIYGRWTFNKTTTLDGLIIVIGFEQVNDAVMFRLMDGETAWREEVKSF